MDNEKTLTRGEFLRLVGSFVAAAVIMKMTSTRDAILGVTGQLSSSDEAAYGTDVYGGSKN